jgi:hypothetical protein
VSADDLDEPGTVAPERDYVAGEEWVETPLSRATDEAERLPADAPPGETYGARQAAQVLGVSARRVSQLAQDGRLEVVQDRPLRVSAQSVHELRAERRAAPAGGRAQATPPESIAEQVERLVSLVTAEHRKAIEAGEALLGEVSSQRDELRGEVERLRAEVERERARADELAERLTVPQVVEEPRRRRWWGR